jgi:Tol biopolymer transport system component
VQKRSIIWFAVAIIVGLSGVLLVGLLLNKPSNLQVDLVDKSKPRSPEGILYLSPSRSAELWRSAVDGSQPKKLTQTGGKVLSFDVLPDGSRVVFSAENSQMGKDLYTIGSDGSGQKLLVACAQDQCDLPVWSADGRQIAFTRLAAQPGPGETAGLPRPWLVDVASGQTRPLDNDPLKTAAEISWSPDGKQVAFYDPVQNGIQVRELVTGKEFFIKTFVQSVGTWSPDGRQIVFNQEENTSGFSFMKVYRMDLITGKSTLVLGTDANDASDYSVPAWSPDGQWLVFGQRRLSGSPSKQLWLIHPDGGGSKAITDDLAATFAAYRWSRDSSAIVFQSFRFGSSENLPEVMVWRREDGKMVSIAKDAVGPQWLP